MKRAKDLCRREWEVLIDQWIIGRNAERNRAIIKRNFLDGICFEPLATEFGISVKQAKNIVYKGEQILIKHVKE